MTQSIHDIVIIGGGASATLTAWNLFMRYGQKCTIIDPADRPACGLAYSTPSLKNLLNVPAKGMTAIPEDPDHFLHWMKENISGNTTPETFVPRTVYGLYLRHLYCTSAPEHKRSVAIACHRDKGLFTISLENGHSLCARKVVLACGHFDPVWLPGIPMELNKTGRYHHNAWDDKVFAEIAPDDEVTLIGTGLTTVDVLMRLRENGYCGRVTALSRHGLFPKRHASYTPLAAPVFKPGTTAPTASAYLHAFHSALKHGTDWRAAVDSMRPVLNPLWMALPDKEKKRFRRHLQRRWDILRHRMAPHIADILDEEQRAGSLRVLNGHVNTVTHAGKYLDITVKASDRTFILKAGHVINCTGPGLNYRHVRSPLMHMMMQAGEIAPGFSNNGLRCTPEGALISQTGTISSGLFTIGPARLGVLFESIAIPEIRQQAQELAARLVTELEKDRAIT